MAVGVILVLVVMLWGETTAQLYCAPTIIRLTTCGRLATTMIFNAARSYCCSLMSAVVKITVRVHLLSDKH